jgi:hypothetical protein
MKVHEELQVCVIQGFRRDANEICSLLRPYASLISNSVATFRANLSVPSLGVNKCMKDFTTWAKNPSHPQRSISPSGPWTT